MQAGNYRLLASTGPPGMSALWSLTGGKQTWGEPSISVAIDPTLTWAIDRLKKRFLPFHTRLGNRYYSSP